MLFLHRSTDDVLEKFDIDSLDNWEARLATFPPELLEAALLAYLRYVENVSTIGF